MSEPARGLHAIARDEPARAALVTADGITTYADLDARANAVSHVLAERGVGPGDRVAVQLPNGVDVFAAWNGAARLGAQVVPISPRGAPAEVAHIIEDSGSRCLLDAGALLSSAADAPAEPVRDDFLGTPVIWMNYTSGTTGRPKGIVRPTPPPLTEAPPQPYLQFWGFGRDDVHLLTGPAYHTAPGAYAQMHLVEGATVVVMERFDAAACLALIERHRVTNSHMVPANFVRLLGLPDPVRESADLSSVRRIIHGAAPCPPAVKRAMIEWFPDDAIWEYYGASEGMGTVISPAEWLEHPGSVGRAFPGLGIRVHDAETGRACAPGEVGAVHLVPAAGFEPEYHGGAGREDAMWRDGAFTVGDLGHLDPDGYLYLADRRTDLILRGGVNIYPAEVEAALVEHPEVVDAAVVGRPDPELGEVVHAVLEVTGEAISREALEAFLVPRLADYKRPSAYAFVARLPREENGKLRRRLLREQLRSLHSEGAGPTG